MELGRDLHGGPSASAGAECPLCFTPGWSYRGAVPGYRQNQHYQLYECRLCGVVAADPRQADATVYADIYAQPERIPGYARYSRYAREILSASDPLAYLMDQEAGYWALVEGLRRHLPGREASILEVGCGMGYLTYALTRAGYRRVLGIDLSPAAVAAARRRYQTDFRAADITVFAGQTAERFDAIVVSEVIEHLEDPAALIAAARSLLKPGGCLICTTPNRDFGGLVRQIWATELPPVHLWWFGEDAVDSLARRLGLAVSFVDFTDWNRRYFYRFCKDLRRSLRAESAATPVLDASGQPRVRAPSTRHHSYSRRRHLLEKWRNVFCRLRYPHLWFGRDIRRSVSLCAIFTDVQP